MPMLVPGGWLPEASLLPCTSGGSIGATPSPIAKSAAFGDARRLTPTPASLNILLSSPIIAFCPLEFSRKFEPIYMLKVQSNCFFPPPPLVLPPGKPKSPKSDPASTTTSLQCSLSLLHVHAARRSKMFPPPRGKPVSGLLLQSSGAPSKVPQSPPPPPPPPQPQFGGGGASAEKP